MKKKNNKKIQKKTLLMLFHYLKPYSLLFILSLLSAIISVVCLLSVPILTGDAIDLLALQVLDLDKMRSIFVSLAILITLYGIFQWCLNFFTTKLSHLTIRDIRRDAFQKILHLPLAYLDSHPHGDILARMANDVDLISTGLIQGFTSLFSGVITIIGTLGFMISKNYLLALVVFAITPLSLFVASYIAKHSYKEFSAQSRIQGELMAITSEMIGEQKLVQALTFEEDSFVEYETKNQELKKVGFKAQWYSAMTNPCTRFVNGLVYSIVGTIGVYFVWHDQTYSTFILSQAFSIGALSCFLTYANQYTKPFNEISAIVNELQTAFSSADRIFEFIQEPSEVSDDTGEVLQNPTGEITCENVTFSYTPEQHLIENFNLKVKPGQKIAIVGPTGCGKTTLINLLMRFYDVKSGSIQIDQKDIRNLTRESLRDAYGMVLQDTWVFHGTIKENIAYGKKNATMEEIEAAAKFAHLSHFIHHLPQGYDTIIKDGSSLSEGQKQLLCIARVMISNPSMLILDEATSNIDTLTEVRIQQAFDEMMKGRTSFVIAHRLSTIVNSDWILVMNHGNIIEQGTHQSLLALNGFYAKLYRS
jgi:ATP-binding cassette subfamily B multidrug efflux pump